MNRSEFIKKLGVFLGSTTLGVGITAKSIPREKSISVLSTRIAGYMYYDGESVEDMIGIDDPVELRREPTNKFDSKAIEVYWKGIKLGYIPANRNEVLANLMDSGIGMVARVNTISTDSSFWDRVGIDIYLLKI